MKSLAMILALPLIAAVSPAFAEVPSGGSPVFSAVVSPDYVCTNATGNNTIAIRTANAKVWTSVEENEGIEAEVLAVKVFRSPHTFNFSLQISAFGEITAFEMRLRQDFATQQITATAVMGNKTDVYTCKFIPRSR